ncbi:MAG: hypothetical protein K0R55_2092 [Sporomusa sp.]|jgi:hypothetical protein|nr:hypothetical protein [Sporomusa sp.]
MINLNNGETLNPIAINAATRYFQGLTRDCIELQFSKTEVTFEQLDALFSDQENTKRLIIESAPTEDAEGNVITPQHLHENYTLRVSLGLVPVVLATATSTTPEITEERYSVIMAQKTYAEVEQDAMKERLAQLEALLLGK